MTVDSSPAPGALLAPHCDVAHVMRLCAPPDRVFPLLCPVREYDWIPDWRCEVLHAPLGAAGPGCVFRTAFPGVGTETWTCVRFEPPRAIEYVRFAALGLVTHLTITLAPDGAGGATVLWHNRLTATTDAGRDHLADGVEAEYHRETAELEAMLDHYLRTGTMLRGTGTA
ncbi:SRPBCC family protein [Desulfocurvus vexinensis]|uniref:SRPBCC family protein n=1 Tax=Desulfocurvus vexinensis TaxID=399548 RepID=UPI00048EDB93|nr:SRPBCC family protein [Desulfocurvus vexinensis]